MFGDPELNQLEQQGGDANQELKAAVQRFFEAREQMNVTRAGIISKRGLNWHAYANQRTSGNAPLTTGKPVGSTSSYNDFSIPLDFSYEVDLWGRVRRSVESSKAQMQARR